MTTANSRAAAIPDPREPSGSPPATVNPDLARERSSLPFDPLAITNFLDGGSDATARRRKLEGWIIRDPTGVFSNEDNNYIPEEETTEGLYDNDELIQDDKEEDLVDLSYYKTDTGHGVGHKLNKGRTPKPDVTGMSLLEATIVLNQWKVQRKAYNDQVQREHMKTLGTKTPPGIQHSGVLNSQLRMISEV